MNKLKTMNDWLRGYMEFRADSFNPAIVFDESGKCRLSSIIGWIMGLADAGQDKLAEQLSADLLENLERLPLGSQMVPIGEEHNGKTPSIICVVHDDGTKHGFALNWYRYDKPLSYGDKLDERCIERGSFPRLQYRYMMTGGLLYHGPRGGEVFAVTLGDTQFWGIHT